MKLTHPLADEDEQNAEEEDKEVNLQLTRDKWMTHRI